MSSKIGTTEVIAALVGGRLCIICFGAVRVYDPIAGFFSRCPEAPSLSAVKAAFTAGRVRKVYV
jgi:hypothetical protein